MPTAGLGFVARGLESTRKRMTKPLRPLDFLEARNHSSSKGVGGDMGIRSQRQSIPLAPSAPKLWLFLDPLREF